MPYGGGGARQAVPIPRTTPSAPARVAVTEASPPSPIASFTPTHNIGKFSAAVHQVFNAQPPHIQSKIVQAAVKNPSHPASNAILSAAKAGGPSIAQTGQPWKYGIATNPKSGTGIGFNLGNVLRGAESLLHIPGSGGIGDVRSLGGAISPSGIIKATGAAEKGITTGIADLRGLANKAPGGTSADIASVQGGNIGQKFGTNVASDAANLLGAPLTTLALTAKDVTHPSTLVNDFIQFPKQLIEHPVQTFEQHPLLSAAVVQGGVAGLSRLGAAPIRTLAPEESALGRAVSTQREGVQLIGKMTHERPPFSKAPSVKAEQKAAEVSAYERNAQGQLIPRSDFQHARLTNKAVGELAGVRNRIRVVHQDTLANEHVKAIAPGPVGKFLHATKNALVYGPEAARIPGANMFERIADTTVRRPETYTQDLQKHLEQVAANRPNLSTEADLKAHDAYVRLLQQEIAAKRTPQDLAKVFKAVAQDRQRYTALEAQAHALGHYGPDMTPAGLQARALQHYASTHMGARMDPELGLVQDKTLAGTKPGAQTPTIPVSLPNDEILRHLNGPEGTGGRLPTYTSDKVRLSAASKRKAYYKGTERPLPLTKKNTLYAYPHGLTNPTEEGALLRNLELRSAIDSHHTVNTLIDQLANTLPGGGYGDTYAKAEAAGRPYGLVPINVAKMFHPQESLSKAMEKVSPLAAEEHAAKYGFDLSERTKAPANDKPGLGRWALIDPQALRALNEQSKAISPSPLVRTIRGLNTQFRTVALSLSPKHVPGVMFENLIRDIANGVGFRSWLTGKRAMKGLKQTPEGQDIGTGLTGGQQAGMTLQGKVYHVSDHWQGTSAYPFLKGWEGMTKAPGLRQARTLWNGYSSFVIKGVKKVLEQEHQTAGVGKALLMEHGYAEAARTQGFVGMFQRALGLHGKMLEDAVQGLYDPAKARQMRAIVNRMYGKWTDLSPAAQTGLMFSPFGLWWANSAKFLIRMPIDMPVKTGMLASLTAAKQKEREALHMNLLSPGALPGYEMGGIPANGKIIAQNYYSPFGMVNDPTSTAISLVEPWLLTPANSLALGINWLGKPLTAPGQNTSKANEKNPSVAQRIQYTIDSVLASFVPLYLKAQQVAEGGASAYDVNPKTGILPPLLTGKAPLTKQPGKGALAGLQTATRPFRQYTPRTPGGVLGGTWGGGAAGSSSSSSGGWGGSSGSGGTSGGTGGWG